MLTPISTSDTAIAQLKTIHHSLTEQITLLTAQCDIFTSKARKAISTKNKILALSALKSRKLSETAIQKRSDALARIEEVLNGIDQAASDAEVIKTLEGGARTLEKLNKDVGGIARVEQIMEKVREGVEEAEEVGRVIAELGSSRVDESEVEDELEAILEEQKERELKEQKERELKEQKLSEKAQGKDGKEDALVKDFEKVSLRVLETADDNSIEGTVAMEEPVPA
jgi:charged multivesicular body protein 7